MHLRCFYSVSRVAHALFVCYPLLFNMAFDYSAFAQIVDTMNKEFKGKHIGLPKIGAGLAGGSWPVIKSIIHEGLKDCKVTVVNYKKSKT